MDEKYALCPLSVIPLRKESADAAEQISQVLFGECFEVLEVWGNWAKIKTTFDDYIGWIDSKQLLLLSCEQIDQLQKQAISLARAPISFLKHSTNEEQIIVSIGSGLPFLKDGKILSLGESNYTFEGISVFPDKSKANELEQIALAFLHAPYLWGGRSVFGVDCSGFTQLVYRLLGIRLKRDSKDQALQGTTVNLVHESKTGDLAFFDNEEGNIVHVGILLDSQRIIHASGQVRIDHFDHQGIFREDINKYSHNLRIIKRYI